MPTIVKKITQKDLDKLPLEIRNNPAAMTLIKSIISTYTKLEQILGYDLVFEEEKPVPTHDTPLVTPVDPDDHVPIKLAHGAKSEAPEQDRTNEAGARRTDLPGISEVRCLETKSDKFLIVPKDKLHSRKNADGTVTAWGDDFVGKSGTVYCYDAWTFLKDKSEKVHDNPVTVSASHMKRTTRARWQAYEK